MVSEALKEGKSSRQVAAYTQDKGRLVPRCYIYISSKAEDPEPSPSPRAEGANDRGTAAAAKEETKYEVERAGLATSEKEDGREKLPRCGEHGKCCCCEVLSISGSLVHAGSREGRLMWEKMIFP